MGDANWYSDAKRYDSNFAVSAAALQAAALANQQDENEAQQKMRAAQQLPLCGFYPQELSYDQKRMVDALWLFFCGKQQVFLLKGYAGTGKTFLLSGLVRYLNELQWPYCCCAPTGKAAQVLREKSGADAITIHKAIYNFSRISDGGHSAWDDRDNIDKDDEFTLKSEEEGLTLVGHIKDEDIPSCQVLLIDESSMISDTLTDSEEFICGTGKLLSDIFAYLNLSQFPGRKVIFIGDAAQLQPVGSKISPALSAQYLKEHFGVAAVEENLSTIVRQQAQSAILQSSLHLRQGLQNSFYNELRLTLKPGEVDKIPSFEACMQELAQCYVQDLTQHRMPQTTMICCSNKYALSYNLQIRRRIFNLPPYRVPAPSNLGLGSRCYRAQTLERELSLDEYPLDLRQGDLLLVLRNNYSLDLYNGQLVVVAQFDLKDLVTRDVSIRLSKKEQSERGYASIKVTLKFLPVQLLVTDNDGQWIGKKVIILTNALYSPERSISKDEQRALYVDFVQRNSHLHRGSQEFTNALVNDPFFNAVQVHFGYALTCHKAQGSEWQKVFVDCNGAMQANEYSFRWLYTAITRAKACLTLINYHERKVSSTIKIANTFNFEQATSAVPQAPTSYEAPVTHQAPSYGASPASSAPSYGAPLAPQAPSYGTPPASPVSDFAAPAVSPTPYPDYGENASYCPPYEALVEPEPDFDGAGAQPYPDYGNGYDHSPKTRASHYQAQATPAPAAPAMTAEVNARTPAEQLVAFCTEQCRKLSLSQWQFTHLASLDYQEQIKVAAEREGQSMTLQVYYGGNDCYSRVLLGSCTLPQDLSNKLVEALQVALKGRSRYKLMKDNGGGSAVVAVAAPDLGNAGFNSFLQRLQELMAQNNILTLSWQQMPYRLRVKFQAIRDIPPKVHSGDSVEIDFLYNGKWELKNIEPARHGEGSKPLAQVVIALIKNI